MKIRWTKLIGFAVCLSVLLPSWVSLVLAADVNALYKKHCTKCHGPEGKADGKTLKKLKATATDWTNKEEMAKLSDQDILDIIWKGGRGVGKSKKMPRYSKKLSEEQAKELAAFVRSFAK